MGCGCKGGGQRNTTRGGPVVSPRQGSISGGLAAGKTPSELRQIAMQKQASPNGIDAARRAKEAERRAAIKKALGQKG